MAGELPVVTIVVTAVDKLDVANSLFLVSSCMLGSPKKESRSTSSFHSRILIFIESSYLGEQMGFLMRDFGGGGMDSFT